MLSYHNDPAIKGKYIKRIQDHRKADNLIRGKGWTGQKGCAVGCTLERYEHSGYETELGIPREVARLEDVIFEELPIDKAMKWPELFLQSVPIGKDLSMIWPKFTVWTLNSVLKYATPDGKKAINNVIGLFNKWISSGKRPSIDKLSKAKDAPYVADSTYAAYAAYAASSAAYAADAYAAYAADAYAAAADGRERFWLSAADELIRLIKETEQ
jgi:hypothetical protein